MKASLALAAALLLGGFFAVQEANTARAQVACTEEARQCPDGTFVARGGPNCEFALCPTAKAPAKDSTIRCIKAPCPGTTPEPAAPSPDLSSCTQDAECVVVPYKHCCGSTKRAINKNQLESYNSHPEWQVFDGPDCAAIGVCAPDANVTTAECQKGQCQLIFP